MNHTLSRIVRSAGALLLAGAMALAGAVALLTGAAPAQAADCLTPRADSASGATFTITSGTVAPGGTITFTGTGFQRTQTDNLGQTLSFKLNDDALWSTTVKAADDGTVSGSLSLADLSADDVTELGTQACGSYWVRVLVGSAAAGDLAPNRSLHATFQLQASAAGASTTTASGTASSTSSSNGGAATTTTGSGQLPQTGVGDEFPTGWVAGAAGVAVVALIGERVVTRRRTTAPR